MANLTVIVVTVLLGQGVTMAVWLLWDQSFAALVLGPTLGATSTVALIGWRLLRPNARAVSALHRLVRGETGHLRLPQLDLEASAKAESLSAEDIDAIAAVVDPQLSEIGYWLRMVKEHIAQIHTSTAAQVEQYETMLGELPLPVIVFDAHFHIDWYNDAAQNAIPKIAPEKSLLDLIYDPRLPEHIVAVIQHQQAVHCEEVRLDGQHVRYYSLLLASMPNRALPACQTETARRGVMIMIDKTAVRWATERGVDFVANVSHELRTPLTSMMGFLETIRRSDISKDDRESALKIMQKQTARMVRLVDDLLILASLDEPGTETSDSLVDLCKIVQQEADSLQKQAKKGGHKIVLEMPGEAVLVLGHEMQLSQVVQNLLDNAIKYSKDGTKVEVRLETLVRGDLVADFAASPEINEVVRFTVRDYGDGIAEQHLPHLTTRFYRIDRNRSRESGGTGLGLAIVKHIIQNHQGTLQVDSEVGAGSCFSVLLPGLGIETEHDLEAE